MTIAKMVLTSDMPNAAYVSGIRVVEEFNALANDYARLIETQRALLAAGNFETVARATSRGDALSRRAEACGRQLVALDDAMWAAAYSGPRTRTLRTRILQARTRADRIGAAAAQLAATCSAEREQAATGLGIGQAAPPSLQRGYRGYTTPVVPATVDKAG